MDILRQYLAVMVAVLVANPACCCTIGTLLGLPSVGGSAAPAVCCCAPTPAPPGSPQEAPSEQGPECPCANHDQAVVGAKLAMMDFQKDGDFAGTLPATCVITLRAGAQESHRALRLDLPPPGAPWRLYCRYLL